MNGTASWLPEPLQTERLYLRPTCPGDEDWIIRLFTDDEVRKYLGGAMSRAATEDFVQLTGEKWGHFAVIELENDNVIGSLSFARKSGSWEISYQLFSEYWGRGYAEEAIKTALRWFFDTTGENEVSAVTQIANKQSCRLLEKLGAIGIEKYEYKGALQRRYIFNRLKFSC